jgi:hypothetical protein
MVRQCDFNLVQHFFRQPLLSHEDDGFQIVAPGAQEFDVFF